MVQNYMMGEMCRNYEGAFSLADAWIFIETADVDRGFFTRLADGIQHVTQEEIQELARKYFTIEDQIAVAAGKKM